VTVDLQSTRAFWDRGDMAVQCQVLTVQHSAGRPPSITGKMAINVLQFITPCGGTAAVQTACMDWAALCNPQCLRTVKELTQGMQFFGSNMKERACERVALSRLHGPCSIWPVCNSECSPRAGRISQRTLLIPQTPGENKKREQIARRA
jgi:hypothetical protein